MRSGSMVLPEASMLVVGTGWDLLVVEKAKEVPMVARKAVAVISFIVGVSIDWMIVSSVQLLL